MANTGYKQATIAYLVTKQTGEPLDINGVLTSTSGLKQAIALLEGTANPNPALYEVMGYFTADGILAGEPTTQYAPEDCPTGLITASPIRIVLHPDNPTAEIRIDSAGSWHYVGPDAFVSFDITSGDGGTFYITATRTGTEGQGFVVFQNNDSGEETRVYIINVNDITVWILDTGFWNDLGFWFAGGVWNY